MILSEFIVYGVLPFLLVFVLVFAILQKSKILGDKKNQIDALVSLVIALILVVVPGPQKGFIVEMMPWLSVALVVMLVFFLLYGFVVGDLSQMPKWMKITFGIMAGVFVLAVIVYLTNLDEIISNLFGGTGTNWLVNGIILLVVIGGIIWVVREGKS